MQSLCAAIPKQWKRSKFSSKWTHTLRHTIKTLCESNVFVELFSKYISFISFLFLVFRSHKWYSVNKQAQISHTRTEIMLAKRMVCCKYRGKLIENNKMTTQHLIFYEIIKNTWKIFRAATRKHVFTLGPFVLNWRELSCVWHNNSV